MSDSRLVYSTDGGRVKHADERAPAKRGARPSTGPDVPNDGVVRLFRERGGRGGKVVTVIRGLPERGAALDHLACDLKRFCGCGGAVKDRVVELQGDHRDRLAEKLRSLGYTLKIAGG